MLLLVLCVAAASGAEGKRELAASCGVGSGNVIDAVPSGLLLDKSGIRLRSASGSPSFDSEGQVQGRLEVEVGDDWVTFASYGNSFGGAWAARGEEEATVACRQLGNQLGYALVSASKVASENTDDGSGMIYKVACEGTEQALDLCTTFKSWMDDLHHYDVGVSCTFLAPGNECEECAAGTCSDIAGVAGCDDCASGVKSPCCAVEDEDDLSGDASREVVGAVVAIFAIVCTVYCM
jgi:hypothetical protein